MNDSKESYWQAQKASKPIYSDLIWSQPQNSTHAGKLLIVGGNAHGFSAPANAYASAFKAGIGSVKVCLPDKLKVNVGLSIIDAVFCPSTPSGSFAKLSLADMLDFADWSDTTLLAGDFGRNSETAMLLEAFVTDYKGNLCITKDALDYFTQSPGILFSRRNTLIVGTMAQLRKISIKADPDNVITLSMGLLKLIEALHNMTERLPISIITKHEDNLIVARRGKVSSTKMGDSRPIWRIPVSSYASVWWLQNPDEVFEALTSAVALYIDSA
jgi:NAD(P)H-hydrate repair Nnr-like enzyme with NAD(P)H-hydrate dehydratase domain